LRQSHARRSENIIYHRVKNRRIDYKFTSAQQLLEKEIIDIIPDNILDVTVILPTHLAALLNDAAYFECDIGGQLWVTDPSFFKVTPRESPERLGMAIVAKACGCWVRIVSALLRPFAQFADIRKVGHLADPPLVEIGYRVADQL
jgi:hypothetical protein